MPDWGGKVAAWFGVVTCASWGLTAVVGTVKPLSGWMHVLLIVFIVIGTGSFIALLLTGPVALASWWGTRRHVAQASETGTPQLEEEGPSPAQPSNTGREAQPPPPEELLPPDSAGLRPEQAEILRNAISAFDNVLGADKRFSRSYAAGPSPPTTVLLLLPRLEEQLEKLANINVTTWPDARSVTSIADAAVRAQDSLRRFQQYVYRDPGHAHDAYISTPYEQGLRELQCSIKRLRDLITREYCRLYSFSGRGEEGIKRGGERLIEGVKSVEVVPARLL